MKRPPICLTIRDEDNVIILVEYFATKDEALKKLVYMLSEHNDTFEIWERVATYTHIGYE